MSWRTSTPIVWARSLGRALGINVAIVSLIRPRGYEIAYDTSLCGKLRGGECVWDVGANVGHYTRQFAGAIGSKGKVWAFEPSPRNALALRQACASLGNVEVLQLALGRQDGKLSFQQGADDLGATSRVCDAGPGSDEVQVRSGRSLIEQGVVDAPNLIKIDVEGFELEVLEGLGDRLASPELRAIGVEVHFGILQERGMPQAPHLIERMLLEKGFSVAWPDASHILATRIV